jgi:hypothetical protein
MGFMEVLLNGGRESVAVISLKFIVERNWTACNAADGRPPARLESQNPP